MQHSREIMQDRAMEAALWAAAFAVMSVATAFFGNAMHSLVFGLAACWLAHFAVKFSTFCK